MPQKPQYPPDWAQNESILDSTATNGDNQNHVIDPGSTARDEGYRYKDVPPYEDHNYLFKIHGKWIRWAEGIFDYISNQMAVITSEDYSLEALAFRAIADDDLGNQDLKDKAAMTESLYRGNVTKAGGSVEVSVNPSQGTFDLNWTNSYNIDTSNTTWNTTDEDTLDLAFVDTTNWTPTTLWASIEDPQGESGGLLPPVLKANPMGGSEIAPYHWDGANTVWENTDLNYLSQTYSGDSFYHFATIHFGAI